MAGWLFSYIGRFVIAGRYGLRELAIYAVVFQAANVFSFVAQVIRVAWTPVVMYEITNSSDSVVSKFVSKSTSYYLIFGAVVLLTLTGLSKYILMLIAGKEYWGYAGLIKFGLIMVYLQGLSLFTSVGNLWSYKTGYNAIGVFLGGVVFVGFLIWPVSSANRLMFPMIGVDVGMFINVIIVWLTSSYNLGSKKINYNYHLISTVLFIVFILEIWL
jgi:O-antigen/teichoic acid export membrane protein